MEPPLAEIPNNAHFIPLLCTIYHQMVMDNNVSITRMLNMVDPPIMDTPNKGHNRKNNLSIKGTL